MNTFSKRRQQKAESSTKKIIRHTEKRGRKRGRVLRAERGTREAFTESWTHRPRQENFNIAVSVKKRLRLHLLLHRARTN
jgi:hypothetical protein